MVNKFNVSTDINREDINSCYATFLKNITSACTVSSSEMSFTVSWRDSGIKCLDETLHKMWENAEILNEIREVRTGIIQSKKFRW